MATTYEAMATVTVGSGGAANIEFTSIPGTYTDLYIILSARSTASFVADEISVQFNGSTSNFTYRRLYSTGSSPVTSANGSNGTVTAINGANSTASVFSNSSIYISNYTSSNNKSVSSKVIVENNATRGDNAMYATLWSNTAAITSIKLLSIGNFAQYSTATLYGIKNS